jgi:hypothetical protein
MFHQVTTWAEIFDAENNIWVAVDVAAWLPAAGK